MTFLAALLARLAEWALEKGYLALSSLISQLIKREKIEKQSDASVEPLKKATTPDEIDKASDSTLNGT